MRPLPIFITSPRPADVALAPSHTTRREAGPSSSLMLTDADGDPVVGPVRLLFDEAEPVASTRPALPTSASVGASARTSSEAASTPAAVSPSALVLSPDPGQSSTDGLRSPSQGASMAHAGLLAGTASFSAAPAQAHAHEPIRAVGASALAASGTAATAPPVLGTYEQFVASMGLSEYTGWLLESGLDTIGRLDKRLLIIPDEELGASTLCVCVCVCGVCVWGRLYVVGWVCPCLFACVLTP